MIRFDLSIAIALSGCLALSSLVGCAQYSSPVSSQNNSFGGAPQVFRSIGSLSGNQIGDSLFVDRAVLYPGQIETGQTDHQGGDVLFIYLLIRPAADEDKRTEALRAYACYVPSPGTRPLQSNKAVFLVPGRVIAGAKLDEYDRSKLFQELSAGGYDYDTANQLIWQVGRWSNAVPDARGIFVVEVDRPIPLDPRRGRAYDLAGLPSSVVRDWIIDEISSVEGGWSADSLFEIHRAKPSWPAVISAAGNLFQIIPASNASRIQSSCP
jgi:hypothetical protein